MPGTIDYDPPTITTLSTPTAVPIVVRAGLVLPNIECVSVSLRSGPEPGTARFRYRFDQTQTDWPASMEQVMMLTTPGVMGPSPYLVQNEDLLTVYLPLPDGTFEPIFSGYARLPQGDAGEGGELVTFEAVGAPERCFDIPVPGALYRDASNYQTGQAIWTTLPTRFNPDGRANGTVSGYNHTVTGSTGKTATTPIFIDDVFVEAQPTKGRKWSLAMAARYLIVNGNVDETYVKNPDLASLDLLLSSVTPSALYAYIDWRDPATYVANPIVLADTDITGMSWPEALDAILAPHGFGMAFVCGPASDGSGSAEWRLIVRRNDDNTYWKTLGMQARGSTLDPNQAIVQSVSVQRDGMVANQVVVDTAPERFEASFILAPCGWSIDAANDSSTANRPNWIRGQASFDPVKYRVFGVDECGEGHLEYPGGTPTTVYLTPDFDDLFDPERKSSSRIHVDRRRPALRELLSKDAAGEPRSAELWFAALPNGNAGIPGLYRPADWAGVTWQQVTEGGWKLLPDRLGILITTEDVRAWHTTKEGDRPVMKMGVLDLVKSLSAPSTTVPIMPRIVFRLTCVVEADQGVDAKATKRAESPTQFTVQRRVDARDRFRRDTILGSSIFSSGAISRPRDDTTDARTYAEGIRRDREALRFAGTLTIPRITTGIRICDKVIGLAGRGFYFGAYTPGTKEGPRYPMVVGLDWTFGGDQSTRVMLADRRAEAQ